VIIEEDKMKRHDFDKKNLKQKIIRQKAWSTETVSLLTKVKVG